MEADQVPAPVVAPTSPGELNKLLHRLGVVQRKKKGFETTRDGIIARAKSVEDAQTKSLKEQEDALIDAILTYAIANKDSLTDTQTITLSHGTIKFKKDGTGKLVFTTDEDSIAAKLIKLKSGKDFVVIKRTPNKIKIKGSPKIMKKLGKDAEIVYTDTAAISTNPRPDAVKRGVKPITSTRDVTLAEESPKGKSKGKTGKKKAKAPKKN